VQGIGLAACIATVNGGMQLSEHLHPHILVGSTFNRQLLIEVFVRLCVHVCVYAWVYERGSRHFSMLRAANLACHFAAAGDGAI
jgi:hypothetical protein